MTSASQSMPAEAVVRFENVCVDRRDRRILENISFQVPSGAFVGLVGPNGAGKTTLLKTMLGLISPSSGTIEVLGLPPGRHRGAPTGVGYVPQRHSIEPHFPASVYDVVAMGRLRGLALFARPGREERDAILHNLDLVGIADLQARPVGELSGGQQRRVMLAQALCASTRLLVLDEPTIGLDLPAEHEFYALLRDLQARFSLSVIAVSHDLLALAGECDELICINRQMHIHGHPEDVIHSHAIQEAYSCEFDFLAGEIAHHEGGSHDHGHASASPALKARTSSQIRSDKNSDKDPDKDPET
jgi:zinc transport system ATP-binding protein